VECSSALPLAPWSYFGDHSFMQLALGLYLISLGINYVPMLIHAIAVTRADSARTEMSDEQNDKRSAMAKYRRQSILYLIASRWSEAIVSRHLAA